MRRFKILSFIMVLLFVFVLVSCGEKNTGKYYEYYDGVKQDSTYLILNKNKWEDESGDSGKYKITGTDIDFYTTFFGAEIVLFTGTIKDGVITFTLLDVDYVYAKDGKFIQPARANNINVLISHEGAGIITQNKYSARFNEQVILSVTNTNESAYQFLGWYVENKLVSSNLELEFKMPNKSVDVTAKYTEKEYNIIYHLDGGINNIDQVNVFTISSDGLLLEPTKEEHEFEGWYLEESFTTKVYSISDLELNDVTLYAKFSDEATLAAPELMYIDNTLSWTSLDHEYVDRYHLYIDGEFVKDLGYNLYFDEIDDYINDGLRHELKIRAVALDNSFSYFSNKITKLETPIITETEEDIISLKTMSWKAVLGASSYKIIKKDEEVILDSNVLTYNFSNYAGTTIKLIATGEGSYINSEIKEIDLPNVKIEGSFVYLGKYPQTVVDNTSLINELNKLTQTNSNGYYEYEGNEYAKLSANPYNTSHKFSNGETIVKNNIYYFKVEPIKWRILQQASGTYTLLTDMILDQEMFYTSTSSRTIGGKTIYANNYEHSTIREWLNNGFYNKAFKAGDKTVILTSFIDNSASTTYSSSNQYACNNTNDKVYLLSYQEASNIYFSSNSQRQAIASDYARARNVYIASNNFSYWWLRSPYHYYYSNAYHVSHDGTLNIDTVNTTSNGVRPALKIKID